jgi:hypothetical protein
LTRLFLAMARHLDVRRIGRLAFSLKGSVG